MKELRRLVGVQGDLVQSDEPRITPLEAGLGPPTLRADDPETGTPSRGTTLHGNWVPKGGAAYAVSAVRLNTDAHGTLLGVMTTHITATLAPGDDAFDGSSTFKATRPDGRVLSRDRWHAVRQPDRADAMSERACTEAREP